jgi:hypothetical protein
MNTVAIPDKIPWSAESCRFTSLDCLYFQEVTSQGAGKLKEKLRALFKQDSRLRGPSMAMTKDRSAQGLQSLRKSNNWNHANTQGTQPQGPLRPGIPPLLESY